MAEELLDSEGDLSAPSPMDAMRGTNFIAGRLWLRERGLEAQYLEAIPAGPRRAIEDIETSDWAPMSLVLPHYAALDGLPLSYEERIEMGATISRNINGVVLTTIARLAGKTGLSPFTPLARSAKLFARNFRGGAIGVFKTGPSEARYEVRGTPLSSSPFHRDNIAGALLDGSRAFAPQARVMEIANYRTATSYAIRVRW